MEMNLPKRSEIKAKYRPEISESEPERELNEHLLRSGLRGQKQFPIGPFFVDLAFPEYRLAIEYDGKIHWDKPVEDYKRHKFIESQGWHILRIVNKGGFCEITLDLKDTENFGSDRLAYGNVFERAVYLVKKFIRDQKPKDPDFLVKYASQQIFDEIDEITNVKGGFKSIGELLKGKLN